MKIDMDYMFTLDEGQQRLIPTGLLNSSQQVSAGALVRLYKRYESERQYWKESLAEAVSLDLDVKQTAYRSKLMQLNDARIDSLDYLFTLLEMPQ